MEAFAFIASIRVVSSSGFFNESSLLHHARALYEGEHGVKKDGTLFRMRESDSGLRRIKYTLDVDDSPDAICNLHLWVTRGFGDNTEFLGEGVVVYSEYGKKEIISGDRNLFVVGFRENSKGNPDQSYEAPKSTDGSYCIA